MAFQYVRVIMMVAMFMCLTSVVLAKEGTAVFYTRPYVPSACYGYRDQGILIAGANPTLYDGGKVCGRRYKVKCLGGTNETPRPCKNGEVTVTMVNLCAGCGANEINLSQDAFTRIANPTAGRVRVSYIQV